MVTPPVSRLATTNRYSEPELVSDLARSLPAPAGKHCMAYGDPNTLNLHVDGVQLFPSTLDDPSLQSIEDAFTDLPPVPGARLYGSYGGIGRLITFDGRIGRIAAAELGPAARPVASSCSTSATR